MQGMSVVDAQQLLSELVKHYLGLSAFEGKLKDAPPNWFHGTESVLPRIREWLDFFKQQIWSVVQKLELLLERVKRVCTRTFSTAVASYARTMQAVVIIAVASLGLQQVRQRQRASWSAKLPAVAQGAVVKCFRSPLFHRLSKRKQ